MSYFRQIHTHIWKDRFFFRLDVPQKLLFVYLFSNEQVSISGLYEIPLEIISFETKLPVDFITPQMEYFRQEYKVFYDFDNEVVWVRNLRKYNASGSATVLTRIEKDLIGIPDCEIKQVYISFHNPSIPYPDIDIPYLYGIDTLSIEEERRGERKEEESIATPSTLPEWLQRIKDSKNKNAELRFMFQTLFPQAVDIPDFGYIGGVSKRVGGAGRLAQLFWETSSKPPSGDVLRYIQGRVRNEKGGNTKPKKEQPSPEKVLEDLENGD